MEQEHVVFTGRVTNVRNIPTKTGRKMVICAVGGKTCKAFGDVATVCEQLDQQQATITATAGKYQGQVEYAVVNVRSLINGHEVAATDVRSVPSHRVVASSRPDSNGEAQHVTQLPQSIAVHTSPQVTESSESKTVEFSF